MKTNTSYVQPGNLSKADQFALTEGMELVPLENNTIVKII